MSPEIFLGCFPFTGCVFEGASVLPFLHTSEFDLLGHNRFLFFGPADLQALHLSFLSLFAPFFGKVFPTSIFQR